jgi:hypothetical protein
MNTARSADGTTIAFTQAGQAADGRLAVPAWSTSATSRLTSGLVEAAAEKGLTAARADPTVTAMNVPGTMFGCCSSGRSCCPTKC